jgi:hypothetical protein
MNGTEIDESEKDRQQHQLFEDKIIKTLNCIEMWAEKKKRIPIFKWCVKLFWENWRFLLVAWSHSFYLFFFKKESHSKGSERNEFEEIENILNACWSL